MAKRKHSKPKNIPWTDFEEANVLITPTGALLKIEPGTHVFKNSRYQVITTEKIVEPFGTILWLSIKRLDRSVIRDWRELQKIKNALAGPEIEAVEIFPAESRLVDTSNQFHLWCFMDGYQIPFGYAERLVIEGKGDDPMVKNSRQRAWDPEDKPKDLLDPNSSTARQVAQRMR